MLLALARGCPELQHLGLELCTAVTEFGLREIAEACKGLQVLNLDGCAHVVPRDRLQLLQRRLPYTALARSYHGLRPAPDAAQRKLKKQARSRTFFSH